jgi:MFS family permease
VFYKVGFGGLSYTWDVLATDVTNLRNRGLAFAFTSSPALISAFAGSKAASDLLAHSNWRWGFGMWAIILPAVALPIYGILAYHLRQAEKKCILVKETENWKITPKTIWRAIVEFDRK